MPSPTDNPTPNQDPEQDQNPDSGTDPVQPKLSETVGRGAVAMMLASLFVKGGTLISQFVLGYLLTEREYGIFGIALAWASVLGVMRDLGPRQLLLQKDQAGYRKYSGSVLKLCSLINAGAAMTLVGIGLVLADREQEPGLIGPFIALAVSILISTPAAVYRAKLGVDLRYGEIAKLQALSATVRYGSMILLAYMGAGAMAMAIPWALVQLSDAAYGYARTKDKPWQRPARVRLWGALLKSLGWLILGAVGIALLNQSAPSVLKLGGADLAVVGVYVFAAQLVVQLNTLLGNQLQQLLLPALTKLRNEPKRHAAATLRAARIISGVGSGFALLLVVIVEPTEMLLWGGKWEAAAPAAQLMALFFTPRLLVGLFNSALLSRSKNRTWAFWTIGIGLGLVASAYAAAQLFETAAGYATLVGAYLGLGVFALIASALMGVGVSPMKLVMGVVVPWSLAVGSGAAVYFPLRDAIVLTGHERADAAIEMAAIGVSFGVLYTLALRLFAKTLLGEMLHVAPGRIRGKLRILLRLPVVQP